MTTSDPLLPRPGRPTRRIALVLLGLLAALAPATAAYPRSGDDWSASDLAAADKRALDFSREARARPADGVPRAPLRYNQLLGTGQSLMEAAQGWPALTREPPPGALMLGASERPRAAGGKTWLTIGPDDLEPLVGAVDFKGKTFEARDVATFKPTDRAWRAEDPESLQKVVARGESPLIAASAALAEAWRPAKQRAADWRKGDDPMVIASNAALGGMTIAKLSRGARPDLYAKIPGLFESMAAEAKAEGAGYQVVAQIHMQGEADYKSEAPDAAAGFEAATRAYRKAIADDAIAATGQAAPPAMFTHQSGGAYARDESRLGVAMSQWRLSREEPGWFLVGPVYQYPDKGGHLSVNGNRWFGAKAGQALKTVLVDGRTWRPLAPLWPEGAARPEVKLRGRSILLPLDIPAPPVRFAPAYVKGKPTSFPSRGFAAFVDGAPVDVESVETAGEALVLVRLGQAPAAGARVELAYATKEKFNGGGNVFDSDPEKAAETYAYRPDFGMAKDEDIPELEGKPYPLENALIAFWTEVARD